MKNYKIVIISLLLVVVCTLCSCGNSSTDKADKNQATKTKATTQSTTDSDDRMCLFKKDKNYEIYQYRYNENSFEYIYFIYDNKHSRIDCKNVYAREPQIVQNDTEKDGKNIVRVLISGGSNVNITKYYNVSNGKVSKEYQNVLCADKKKVAYISYKNGKTILNVQNKFAPKSFFEKELDMGGISTTMFKGEFNGNSITVTHAKGKNYKDVRETFSLNQKWFEVIVWKTL